MADQQQRFCHDEKLVRRFGLKVSSVMLKSCDDGVLTLTMNTPEKLNAWTGPMMLTLRDEFKRAAKDANTQVLILTGSGSYYCAGVSLADTIRPMMPRSLHRMIVQNNQALFDVFLDFPKPIIIACNGPAIGASVTSASLCDAIIAADSATFSTPFAQLCIPPEGCSSVHFARMLGEANAEAMLGEKGWKPTAMEAKNIGLVRQVVPADELMDTARKLALQWVAEGRKRTIPADGDRDELKEVNARESVALADAFLSTGFMRAQEAHLKKKAAAEENGKKKQAKLKQAKFFSVLATTRPVWSLLL